MCSRANNRQRWRKACDKCRERFIVLLWVLAWGLTVGATFAICRASAGGWAQFPWQLVFALVFYPLLGCALAAWTWWVSQPESPLGQSSSFPHWRV